MLASPAALLIPLGLALVIAAGARLSLGAERSAKFVGLAVPLAFLIGWGIIVKPGWYAHDAIGRIAHIVFGGLLVGLLIDLLALPSLITTAAGVIYVLACAWAEVHAGFMPTAPIDVVSVLSFAAVGLLALGLIWRIDVLRRGEPSHVSAGTATLLQLMMMAFSLAAVGAAAEDVPLWTGACILALALGGYLAVSWNREPAVPMVIVFTVTGALLALAWALYERTPQAFAGVGVTGLILFAEGTARRVPLPVAGISRWLYPALLVGISCLPLVLAAVVTFSLRRMP